MYQPQQKDANTYPKVIEQTLSTTVQQVATRLQRKNGTTPRVINADLVNNNGIEMMKKLSNHI